MLWEETWDVASDVALRSRCQEIGLSDIASDVALRIPCQGKGAEDFASDVALRRSPREEDT